MSNTLGIPTIWANSIMTPRHRWLLLIALFLPNLVACASSGHQVAGKQTPPLVITLIGTNDVHGWMMAHDETRADGSTMRVGGADLLASYVAILRSENPGRVVLLDAGDMFQGTLASNMTEGAAVVQVYNAIGYDAVALG